MDLIISNASGKPIYEQICTQIKNAILSGELSPGDALPSIRALAKDLRISVITTTRAYDELERDGFIDRVPGKGCYVAEKNLELARKRLNAVMVERKAHEKLREKAFEQFKQELAAEEAKEIDQLVSFNYHEHTDET